MNDTQLQVLLFLGHLQHKHGKATPRIDSIANVLGVSRRTVQTCLERLEVGGLIRSRQRTARGRTLTKVYALTNSGIAINNTVARVQWAAPLEPQSRTALTPWGGATQDAAPLSQGEAEHAARVQETDTAQEPIPIDTEGIRGEVHNAAPVQQVAPLNKGTAEPRPADPQGASAPQRGSRPEHQPENGPLLTGVPAMDQYLIRQYEYRQKNPPTKLEQLAAEMQARLAVKRAEERERAASQ